MESVTKTCPFCGREFVCRTAAERRRSCCSVLCARRLKALQSSETRKCRACGREFEAAASDTAKTCPDCRAIAALARAERNGFVAVRRCHDCGKPCHQFRCRACWAKLRKKEGIPVSVLEGGKYE